jgi:hypothetical protein
MILVIEVQKIKLLGWIGRYTLTDIRFAPWLKLLLVMMQIFDHLSRSGRHFWSDPSLLMVSILVVKM